MKVMNKIEGIVLAIMVAIARIVLLTVGVLTFYDVCMYSCEFWSQVLVVVAMVAVVYSEIKTCIFRCIEVIKKN